MKTTSSLLPGLGTLLLACTLPLAASCSSGLGNNQDAEAPGGVSTEAALGVDLGLDLTHGIEPDMAVAGALVPGSERRITFVAFSTAAASDDADGLGMTLARDGVASDSNGATDIFVLAIEDELGSRGQPVAFSRALVNTFRHSRCVQCHAMGTTPMPTERFVFPGNNTHLGGSQPVTSDDCSSCHSAPNVSPEVEWRSPRENNGQPFNMRDDSLEELAHRAQEVPLLEHLLDDSRVTWAIESGVVPQSGELAGSSAIWDAAGYEDIEVGPVPISMQTFSDQLLDWEDAGYPVTASGSIRDVAVVSTVPSGLATGNGASMQPSLTWLPDSGFDPQNPGAARAGQLVIAFVSTASDLTPGGTTTADVYRTTLDVYVERDPVTSAPLAGAVDIDATSALTELVSRSAVGGASNGASTAPDIDGTGDLIAYTSEATNLVSGFVNNNGVSSDVFLRDMGTSTTLLVSASSSGALEGGNDESGEPSISAMGEAIAFSSLASDLTSLADDNDVRDVFLTRRSGLITLDPIELVSRPDGGGECDGSSSSPDVAVSSGGATRVVFQSAGTNLEPVSAATTNIFLHEDGEVFLLSTTASATSSTPGDGDSTAPTISPSGELASYQTLAANLDVIQATDENGFEDVMIVELASVRASGEVRGRRASLDSAGQDAKGAASAAVIGNFREGDGFFGDASFVTFRTGAEDLGISRASQDVTMKFLVDVDTTSTNFSVDTTRGAAPLTVAFTDLSTGAPDSWRWDFGDGSPPSEEQNPVHEYSTPGTYSVSLTVTRAGIEDTRLKSDLIQALQPLGLSGLGPDVTSGPAPLQVTFTPQLTGDTSGVVYSWDFGDSFTSTEATPTHVYQTAGTYTVSLTVSGDAGQASLTQPDLVEAVTASGANFTFTATGLRFDFVDASAGDPDEWTWDFGDGSPTSSERNPRHDYATNGSFTVTLSIDGPGGPDSFQRQVEVNAISFSSVFGSFAASSCTGCHGGSLPAGGLSFTTSEAQVFTELVNVPAVAGTYAGCSGKTRVTPFDAGASLLTEIVDPAITACNDAAGMGNFSPAALQTLRDWINQGALQ